MPGLQVIYCVSLICNIWQFALSCHCPVDPQNGNYLHDDCQHRRKRATLVYYTVPQLLTDHPDAQSHPDIMSCAETELVPMDFSKYGYQIVRDEYLQKLQYGRKKRAIYTTYHYHPPIHHSFFESFFWKLIPSWMQGRPNSKRKNKSKTNKKKISKMKPSQAQPKTSYLQHSWAHAMFAKTEADYKRTASARALTLTAVYQKPYCGLDEKVYHNIALEPECNVEEYQMVCYVVYKCTYKHYYDYCGGSTQLATQVG